MATYEAKIVPLTIPTFVLVQVGKQSIEVPIDELSEEQLSELAEEFMKRLFEAAGKKL